MHIMAEAAGFLGSGAWAPGAGFLVLGAGVRRFSPAPNPQSPAPIPGTRHLTPDTSPYCASPAAAFLLPLRLAHRQGMLSRRFLRNFLPVGRYFTIPAANFLPVGNAAASLPTRVTKRPDPRPPRGSRWFGRLNVLVEREFLRVRLASGLDGGTQNVPKGWGKEPHSGQCPR